MNEIDLFTEMIDEDESNKILSYFNETVPGVRKNTATFEQKKIYIKRIFRSKTPNMIRKRKNKGSDPFYAYINKLNFIEFDEDISFKESLLLLKEIEEDFPPYVRFAYLLLKHPNEIREKLEEINQNINDGLDPLTFDVYFSDIEELKSFLRKSKLFLDKNLSSVIFRRLQEYLSNEVDNELKQCLEKMKNFTLMDFYIQQKELQKKFSKVAVNTAFAKIHKDEDEDILLMLALEALFDALSSQNNKKKEDMEGKIKNFEITTLNLKKENEKNIREKDLIIQQLKDDNRKNKKKIDNLKKEAVSIQKKIAQFETNQNLLSLEYESFKIESDKYNKQIIKNFEVKIKELEDIIQTQKLIEEERIQKYQSQKVNTNWGIICVSDYQFFSEMFPELPIANGINKDEYTKLIENTDIQTVYISMRGLSTRRFHTIKQIIDTKKKVYQCLNLNSFKELLEWIGYKKTIEKVELISK